MAFAGIRGPIFPFPEALYVVEATSELYRLLPYILISRSPTTQPMRDRVSVRGSLVSSMLIEISSQSLILPSALIYPEELPEVVLEHGQVGNWLTAAVSCRAQP